MDVIVIHGENYGIVIGVAYDYESAINLLFNEGWFSEDDCNEELGDKWLDVILSWDIDNFNEFFEGCFYLQVETVYDVH